MKKKISQREIKLSKLSRGLVRFFVAIVFVEKKLPSIFEALNLPFSKVIVLSIITKKEF